MCFNQRWGICESVILEWRIWFIDVSNLVAWNLVQFSWEEYKYQVTEYPTQMTQLYEEYWHIGIKYEYIYYLQAPT